MSKSRVWQMAASLLAATMCVGCFPAAKSQLARCQSEKKQLLSRVVDEQKRAEELVTENRTLNEKLADAEMQLAKLHDGRGSRIAEFRRPNAASSPTKLGESENPAATAPPIGKWTPKPIQRPPVKSGAAVDSN